MCIKLHFNFPLVYILCIVPMHTMCIHASWNTEGVLVVGATDALAPAHLPGPLPHLSHPFIAHRLRCGGGGGGGDDDDMRQMVICFVSHAPVAVLRGGGGTGTHTHHRLRKVRR